MNVTDSFGPLETLFAFKYKKFAAIYLKKSRHVVFLFFLRRTSRIIFFPSPVVEISSRLHFESEVESKFESSSIMSQ